MSCNYSFLLITLEEVTSSLVVQTLHTEGHTVLSISGLHDALSAIQRRDSFSAVLLDVMSQPNKALPLLKILAERVSPDNVWLIVPMGVNLWMDEASRLGINNFLRRPLQRHDLQRLLDEVGQGSTVAVPAVDVSTVAVPEVAPSLSEALVARTTKPAGHGASGARPGYVLEQLPNDRYFLAACPAMLKLYENVRLLAAVDVPVLILGESGVGKDVVANLLHKHSLRSGAAYLSVNCAALPTELLESELFGYEAGAFTGAIKAKPGKFELVDNGTLLLDEIGEMTAPMQAKLLHVLQDGRFSRLGARTETQVDVRVIAATNIDMEDAIAKNTFRQDLFYRISAFTISVPPLRERKEEIPHLVEQLLKQHAARFRQEPVKIPQQVIDLMQAYFWPGNLRELSNYVIRMQVLQSTDATVADLSEKVHGIVPQRKECPRVAGEEVHGVEDMRSIVRNFRDQTESRIIQEALDGVGWNRRHAASELRISYRALLYKIQQYGLKNNRRPASGSSPSRTAALSSSQNAG